MGNIGRWRYDEDWLKLEAVAVELLSSAATKSSGKGTRVSRQPDELIVRGYLPVREACNDVRNARGFKIRNSVRELLSFFDLMRRLAGFCEVLRSKDSVVVHADSGRRGGPV